MVKYSLALNGLGGVQFAETAAAFDALLLPCNKDESVLCSYIYTHVHRLTSLGNEEKTFLNLLGSRSFSAFETASSKAFTR